MRALFLLHVLFPLSLLAQTGMERTFSLKKYGTSEGLLHRSVTSITQDRDGFLWIATPVGIQRFDGYTFTTYTKAEGLHGDVPSRFVQDSDGLIWILYSLSDEGQLSGIDILDPRTGRISTFQEHFGARTEIRPGDLITYTRILGDSTLLFAADGRLVSYHGKSGFSIIPLQHAGQFLPLTRGPDGSFLGMEGAFVKGNSALLRISANGMAMDTLALNVNYATSLGTGGEWTAERADAAMKDGTYFIVHSADGRVSECWLSPQGHVRAFGGDHHSDLLAGRQRVRVDDDLWLVGPALRRMHAGDDPLSAPVIYDLAERFPEIGLVIRCILIDRAGHVWLGTEFGLFRLDIRPTHFQRMLWERSIPKGYGERIRNMAVDGDRLHLNTDENEYLVVDARTGRIITRDTLSVGRSGLYVGTDGVWRGQGEHVVHDLADGTSVEAFQVPAMVRSILPLPSGDLLTGTNNGLFRWSPTSGTVSATGGPSPIVDALKQGTVAHLAFVGKELWACTTTGLFRLDDQGVPIERWSSENEGTHYIPTLDVRHLYRDGEGVFWLATGDAGMVRWERNTGEARSIGRRDGMPSLAVHAVYPDRKGRIWAPTDDGLVCYAPSTGQVRVYTTADGIAHNEFNRTAHARGAVGQLYFGGFNGITAFDPSSIDDGSTASVATPLLLTGMHQYDGALGRIVDRYADVRNGAAITMHPGDSFFNLTFALLSFEDPQNILYGWRIDGIDADWNYQRDPDLRITTLPYGDHLLRIKAQGSNGIWEAKELTLPIHVVRPFYLRWWSIALCALALAGILYAVFRYRLAQAKKVFAMRDRIAADLHDEVGSSLSNIAMFGELMRDQAGGQSLRMQRMIERVTSNSAKALESMNDIVWNVNTRFDRFEHLIARMRAFAAQAAEAKGFKLVFTVDDPLPTLKLDMEQRKNVYLIFKEAVNNAAKYSECDELRVDLRSVRGGMELIVSDNGKGFTPGTIDPRGGGNGLPGMQQRAQHIASRLAVRSPIGQGTTISLEVDTGRTASRTFSTQGGRSSGSFAS